MRLTTYNLQPTTAQPTTTDVHPLFQACSKVINQAVGDALSDMLMTLATLHVLRMDLPRWHLLYTDLSSKQLKVAVSGEKKALIMCTEDETRALTPPALQTALDEVRCHPPPVSFPSPSLLPPFSFTSPAHHSPTL